MYTQCSKCETVFRLSADSLRAAGGQVRCGRCGEVFNALARLAEEASAFPVGESSFEQETRADEILHSVEPVAPLQAPVAYTGPETARLEVVPAASDDFDADTALEFTLPPGELDRVFIETPPTALQRLAAAPPAAAAPAPPRRAAPSTVPPVAQTPRAQAPPAQAPPAQAPPAQARPPQAAPAPAAPPARVVGLEVSEDIRNAMLENFTHAELPEINPPTRALPAAAWKSAAVVLALLLVLQVYRSNGGSMPGALHGSSNLAGNLSSYQLRQWGVTGDPGAKGILRVRASIMNTAAQLQPYPLLRVMLMNRFGTRVGARDFEPAEYMGKQPPPMLAPGERIEATLDIVDPGKDAEGFEINLCVRGAAKKTVCVDDAAPQPK